VGGMASNGCLYPEIEDSLVLATLQTTTASRKLNRLC
jgi:hypothetical protein